MSESKFEKSFERLMPLLGVALLSGFSGAMGAPPFDTLVEGADATYTLYEEWTTDSPTILEKNVYKGKGLVSSDLAKMQPGNTLVQGIWPDGAQVRLLDAQGKEVHRWTADFFKIWPDADEVFSEMTVPKSENNYFIQGMAPLSDGSIILNFGQLGAAKLDKCSNLVWRSDRPTHHSVTPVGDGTYWIPGVITVADTPDKYIPPVLSREQIVTMIGDSTSKGYNNSLLLIDDNGKVLKEFSLLGAIYDAGLEHALYASLQETAADPVHLNDIELVTPELAAKIDGTEAGDLLVSIREMNMIAIVDKDDGHLKWHHQGPWVRQHDPDITPDGMIEVFNNRSQYIARGIDTSQIVRFDPVSRKTEVVNPVGDGDKFFTKIMGTHELQPNGNRLIAESIAGRVIEVSPQGEVVWDYRMPFNDEVASLFAAASRLPEDYFGKDGLTCSK